MKGKLIRRSLKTNQLTVAKLRLSDLEKSERQRTQSINAVANGKMTFQDALAMFKSRLQDNPEVKPRTREYYEYRIAALLKSWPGCQTRRGTGGIPCVWGAEDRRGPICLLGGL